MVCGVWCVEWSVVCGVCMVCGVWSVHGVWSVEWSVVCGVFLGTCITYVRRVEEEGEDCRCYLVTWFKPICFI